MAIAPSSLAVSSRSASAPDMTMTGTGRGPWAIVTTTSIPSHPFITRSVITSCAPLTKQPEADFGAGGGLDLVAELFQQRGARATQGPVVLDE
jgi:hypothetical protein